MSSLSNWWNILKNVSLWYGLSHSKHWNYFLITMAMRYSGMLCFHGLWCSPWKKIYFYHYHIPWFSNANVTDWLSFSTQSPYSKLPLWHFQSLSVKKPWPRLRDNQNTSAHHLKLWVDGTSGVVKMGGLFLISPEDQLYLPNNQGTLKLLLRWEG